MNSMELLQQSQIHGVNRATTSNHKWQWTLILLILTVCSNIVFWISIKRYIENPTFIVKVETTKIDKPFPAVVICPEVTFPNNRIEEFLKKLKYPAGLNETYTRKVIRQLAAFFSPDVTYKLVDLRNIQNILSYNDIDIESSGRNLTESCEETVTRCRWRGRLINCKTIFEMELTAYGFCCIFNGVSLERNAEDLHLQRKTHLQRWHGDTGITNALMLVINQSQSTPFDVDLSYKWLSLHGGQRYVHLSVNGTPITPGTELFAGYRTTGLQVDEEAVNLNKNLRRCRMSYDALKYFPVYHEMYCLMEREMDRTIELCGCLKIGHPRLSGVPVCRAQNLQCARRTTVSFTKTDYDCPVACDSEIDDVSVATYDLDPNSSPYDSFYNDLDFNKVSIVRVYVLNRNTKIFSRRPYFTRFDLFAQLGGVFNVFFGCSVLSMLELLLVIRRGFWAWIKSIWISKRTELKRNEIKVKQ